MRVEFHIKQNMTTPDISARLADATGAISLVGASVTFKMRRVADGSVKVERAAAVLVADPEQLTTPAAPNVAFEWMSGDTDTPGLYEAEWVVTYQDGQTQRFPANSRRTYTILEVQKAL